MEKAIEGTGALSHRSQVPPLPLRRDEPPLRELLDSSFRACWRFEWAQLSHRLATKGDRDGPAASNLPEQLREAGLGFVGGVAVLAHEGKFTMTSLTSQMAAVTLNGSQDRAQPVPEIEASDDCESTALAGPRRPRSATTSDPSSTIVVSQVLLQSIPLWNGVMGNEGPAGRVRE